jgi:ketosteroid isomerase-like protein
VVSRPRAESSPPPALSAIDPARQGAVGLGQALFEDIFRSTRGVIRFACLPGQSASVVIFGGHQANSPGAQPMNVALRCFLFLAGFLSPGILSADTRSEITAALEYYAEVWNEGDLETIRGYYHSDFVLITSEGAVPLSQRMDDLRSIARAGEDRGNLEYEQVRVEELGEGHAMAYGSIRLGFKDGSKLESWFSTVYEKTPFGWKAILTHN